MATRHRTIALDLPPAAFHTGQRRSTSFLWRNTSRLQRRHVEGSGPLSDAAFGGRLVTSDFSGRLISKAGIEYDQLSVGEFARLESEFEPRCLD